MREDKHKIRLRTEYNHPVVREMGDPAKYGIGPLGVTEFTIPSVAECVKRRGDIHVKRRGDIHRSNWRTEEAEFHRWFLTYAVTGENPDKVGSKPVAGYKGVVKCHQGGHEWPDKEGFVGVDGVTIDGKYWSMDTLRERLK